MYDLREDKWTRQSTAFDEERGRESESTAFDKEEERERERESEEWGVRGRVKEQDNFIELKIG